MDRPASRSPTASQSGLADSRCRRLQYAQNGHIRRMGSDLLCCAAQLHAPCMCRRATCRPPSSCDSRARRHAPRLDAERAWLVRVVHTSTFCAAHEGRDRRPPEWRRCGSLARVALRAAHGGHARTVGTHARWNAPQRIGRYRPRHPGGCRPPLRNRPRVRRLRSVSSARASAAARDPRLTHAPSIDGFEDARGGASPLRRAASTCRFDANFGFLDARGRDAPHARSRCTELRPARTALGDDSKALGRIGARVLLDRHRARWFDAHTSAALPACRGSRRAWTCALARTPSSDASHPFTKPRGCAGARTAPPRRRQGRTTKRESCGKISNSTSTSSLRNRTQPSLAA